MYLGKNGHEKVAFLEKIWGEVLILKSGDHQICAVGKGRVNRRHSLSTDHLIPFQLNELAFLPEQAEANSGPSHKHHQYPNIQIDINKQVVLF